MATTPIDDLIYLMQRLRSPEGGCPWDREQTFESIVPHTLEESYELADAIESGDATQIREELGDLLFQVIFYAQLGAEQDAFDFNGIVRGLVSKLVRRHPHVFSDGTLRGEGGSQAIESAQVSHSWEVIKQGERREKAQHSALDDVPLALPALTRSAKLQKRAARVGFDWPDAEPIYAKIAEEMQEVREATTPEEQLDEVGDLLFACVNLARHLKVDPERALRSSNRKFERRFRFIEASLREQGREPAESDLETLDRLWDAAKQHERR